MGVKILKKITSMMLAVVMFASVVSSLISGLRTVYAAETGSSENSGGTSSAYNRILNPDVPEDYDETSTVNPYTNDKTKFMLSEESELMVNLSWNLNSTSNAKTYIGVADTYSAGGKMYLVTGTDSNKDKSWSSVEWTEKTTENASQFGPNLNFQQGIAFDPTGSGRKDHVAFVGWSNEDNYNYLWIYDTVNKTYRCKTKLGEFSIEDTKVVYVNAPALYSITAGDYNDDGRDSIVVYNPSHGDGFKVLEYAYDSTGRTLTKLGESQKILHTAYQEAEVYKKKDYANVLGCNLTTGDFDGDGIDDLALISYGQNYNKNGKKFSNPALYEPMIAAVFGEDQGDENNTSSWSVVKSGVAVTKYVWYNETTNSDHKTYESMRSPSISAGDVDGDGMDELVCAGYYSKIKEPTNKTEEEKDVSYATSLDKKHALAVLAEVTKGTENSDGGINCGCTVIDTNKWSQGIGNNTITEQLATACVATKGRDVEEEVFINGTFYDCKTGSFITSYTGSFFNKEEEGNSLAITSVAVGNFTGDTGGREQVMCAASDKEDELIGNDDIYMKCISMGCNQVKDTEGNISYSYYQGEHGRNSVDNKGDHINQCLNACVVAIDNDNDGVIAEYKGKSYVYSDPKIAAVLQAGPYFGEVDDAGGYDDPCETSYSLTTTYEKGTTSADNVSFGAGFAQTAEITLGAAFEEELRVGYALDWTKTFEEATAVSYTTAFTAQTEDQVIISRIPIVVYSYNIYTEHKTEDSTKDYIEEPMEDGYAVSIPGNPVYYQLSIEEYNQFVEEYNKYINDGYKENNLTGTPVTLKKIAKDTADSDTNEYDLPRDSEGNPQNYFSTWAAASGDGVNGASLSQNAIALSYSGGNSTSEWATSESTTKSTETSHGFDFELSVLAGGGLLGNSVKLGGYISLNYMKTSGKFETYAKESGASGTVQNINKAAMLEDGYDEDLVNSYGFNWEFGIWKRKLTSEEDEYTPFYGYRVWDVRMPLSAPANLEVEYSETDAYHSAELTWDPVEDDQGALLGYNVYVLEGDDYKKLTTERLDKDVNSYTVTGLNTNTEYTFVATTECYRINAAGAPDPSRIINSIRSNEASIKTPRKGYKITLTGDKGSEIQALGAEKEIKTGDDIFEGDAVSIRVKAKEGYTIQKILMKKTESEENITETDITSTKGEFNFIVRCDTEIFVTSKKNVDESEIIYQSGEHGSIVSATTAGRSFKSGALVSSDVTLEAKAEDGYVLKEWQVKTGNTIQSVAANGNNTYTFGPFAEKHEITAVFVTKEDPSVTKKITLNNQGTGGTVVVSDKDGEEMTATGGVVTVNVGTPVIITAKADPYYVLGAWSDDFAAISEENTSIQQTVYEDMTIGAVFYAPIKYKIQYDANDADYGTIAGTVKTNTTQVEGMEITFTATPKSGYRLEYWEIQKGNATEKTYAKELQTAYKCTVTLDDTTKVTACFKRIETYKLSVESAYGTVKVVNQKDKEVINGEDISYGDVLTVTATPEKYHEWNGLTINQESVKNGDTYTVYGDVAVKAEYQRLLTTDGKDGELLSDVMATLSYDETRYTGKELTPEVTVKVGNKTLSKGNDYKVTYQNNKEAGSATVIIEGIGFYKGTITKAFTILERYAINLTDSPYGTIHAVNQNGKELKDGDYIYQGDYVTVTAEPNQYYELTVLKANGTSIDNGIVIAVDKDIMFSAEYQRPLVENGEAAQNVNITFSVTNTKYSGKEIKGEVAITVDGKELQEGIDYEVVYTNNVNPGTATATINGKGIYQISLTKTFKITENTEYNQAEMAENKRYTFNNKKISLTWGKVKRATGYDVFFTTCGKNFSKTPTITTKKTSVSITKLNKKKLNNKESYKAVVKAYRMVNGKKRYISTTEIMHIAGANSKYTNAKKITGTPKTKTLKVGKTYKIQAKIVKENKNKPLFKKSHVANLRYRSSDSRVAQVSASGKIKAKGKGNCIIYVIAGNGLTNQIKVTVK